MFGGEKIDKLTEEKDALQAELDSVRPYLDAARDIRDKHAALVAQGEDLDGAYDAAIALVAEESAESARRKVVAQISGRVATEETARIEAEIHQNEGPEMEREAQQEFAENRAPQIRKEVRRQVQNDIQQRVSTTSTEAIWETETAQAIKEELTKRELAERLKGIREYAKTTQRVEFSSLKSNDVITLDLCPENKTYDRSTSQPSRTIRISVRDPEHGIMVIMDDSWREGDPLQQEASLASGAVVTMATGSERQSDNEEPDRAFMRSVPIDIRHGDKAALTARYELHRVWWGIKENEPSELLLGTQDNFRSYR